ncbi:glycosyltransferase [bacterium]|nr:glycosyltransferase [bacterium]
MEIKVSVVIPIYNAEKYLKQCLDSVQNQTLKEIQIICVNDGSTDNSLKIINEYAQNDERFVVISQENSGCGKAYNVGMALASGEYIGFVEPDDYIDKNMYEELYNIAKSNDLDFVKSDFYKFTGDDNLELVKLSKDDSFYNRVINLQEEFEPFLFIINTWCGIYKKNFLQAHNIKYNETPGASFQDTGFWFQTFCYSNKAYFCDKVFYNYRQDNVNSSVNSKSKVYCIKDEYDFIRSILDKEENLHKFYPIYQYSKYNKYMWNLFRISPEYREDWLKNMQKEFIEAFKHGEIDKNILSARDNENIMLLINDRLEFYEKILKSRKG